MPSNLNKPTGLDYSGLQRNCAECDHIEMAHFGKRCYRMVTKGPKSGRECDCVGFVARELTEDERRIVEEMKAERRAKKVEYVGEAWMDDLVRDWKERKIEGIDY